MTYNLCVCVCLFNVNRNLSLFAYIEQVPASDEWFILVVLVFMSCRYMSQEISEETFTKVIVPCDHISGG